MQKKIVALAVAGLSTAAFAQTNVTIYGVADISGQGFNLSNVKGGQAGADGGNTFNVQSNSSLIGFKGTEDLGNGLKALFQAETELNLAGKAAVNYGNSSSTSTFGNLRDSYVGASSKYGNLLGGYISTPIRSTLTSFDVMPGATGSSQIDKQMTAMRFGTSGGAGTQFQTAVRATAIAYQMPTLYGFNGSIAYSGSGNNGTNNSTALSGCSSNASDLSGCSVAPQSAFGFNLGWTGYGVDIKGAFQQNNNNFTPVAGTGVGNYGDYTSYLIGAMYTGLPGLKLSALYNRNSLGTDGRTGMTTGGAGKISNNQVYAGASYRWGNWEPRISATWSSDLDGASVQQYGSRQWTINTGYYLSKRTQVYGLISNLNNSANQNFTFGQQTSNLGTTGSNGANLFTYGMGMRTTF